MKIVAFSDLHAHPFKNGFITEEGRNSRVEDATNVIRQVYEYAHKNEVSYVFFGGDLFDRRKSIDVDTFNQVHEVIGEGSLLVPTVMIPGNHDQANKSGTIHALQRFNTEHCRVLYKPEWVKLNKVTALLGVPYVDDGTLIAEAVHTALAERPQWAKKLILMIHYGVQGARVSPADYIIPCELELAHLSPQYWDLILSGHYHMGQQLGSNFHYIGSAMQHRWDDAGLEKSFIEFDTRNWNITRIPTVAPKFVVATGKTKNYDVNNSFVRIVRDYEIPENSKLEINKKLLARGALTIEYRVEKKTDNVCEDRIDFSEEGGPFSVVEDYVKSDIVDRGDLDIEKLFTMGKELITRAQSA